MIDPDGLCRGCRRTLEEIGGWSSMSDAQREAVLAELPKRPGPADANGAQAPVPPLP